jgi:hypothetical protein
VGIPGPRGGRKHACAGSKATPLPEKQAFVHSGVAGLRFATLSQGVGSVMTLWQDLRRAARLLRRHRGFTLGAALTLSLGISGTVTVLALTKAIVVAPPAVRDPDRVVRLFLVDPEVNDRKFYSRDYRELSSVAPCY